MRFTTTQQKGTTGEITLKHLIDFQSKSPGFKFFENALQRRISEKVFLGSIRRRRETYVIHSKPFSSPPAPLPLFLAPFHFLLYCPSFLFLFTPET